MTTNESRKEEALAYEEKCSQGNRVDIILEKEIFLDIPLSEWQKLLEKENEVSCQIDELREVGQCIKVLEGHGHCFVVDKIVETLKDVSVEIESYLWTLWALNKIDAPKVNLE